MNDTKRESSPTLDAPFPIRVLLLEDEADSLAALGVALLEKGFEVAVATDPRPVLKEPESSFRGGAFHVLLVAEDTLRGLGPELDGLLRARPEPYLVLVGSAETAWDKNEVLCSDFELVAKRVTSLAAQGASPEPPSSRGRAGTLSPGWFPTVALSFVSEHATGMLSVTTPAGAGELRFARGELVDAAYSTLDGAKAVYRLARETEGSWSFTQASSLVMRRITTATADLLRQVPLELERARELEAALGDLTGWALLADSLETRAADAPPLGALAIVLAARLSSPKTLRALLDESPETDAELLAALVELDAAVLLRRVRSSARALTFESPQQLNRAMAVVVRANAAGFAGPARIVFAGLPAGLSMLAYAALALDEAVASAEIRPEAPVPHDIARLRLSEDAAIAIVALPLDPIYSPLWPLTIAGAASVVSLSDALDTRLVEACAATEVPLIEAAMMASDFDLGSPDHVARLVRAALEVTG